MKCKLCGAQMDADMTVCPLCGAKADPLEGADGTPEAGLDPVTPEAPAEVPETPAAPAAEEAAPEEDAGEAPEEDAVPAGEVQEEDTKPVGEAPEEADGGKPRGSGKKLGILIVTVTVVVAALIYAVVSIFGGGAGKEAAAGNDPLAMNHVDEEGNFIAHTYTKENEEITEDEMNTAVASCGDYELTNAQLSFYYWQQVSTYGSYASMMGVDFTKPLSEQMYSTDASWEDLFLQMAMDTFWRTAAVDQAAQAAGFVLDDATGEYLDSLAESMAQEAEDNGYESEDAYVQSAYGPHTTMDAYMTFGRQAMTASGYVSELYSGITYTEDDISAYFDEHQETYTQQGLSKDDPNMVNVRHILIQPVADDDAETDESGNAVLTDQNWADAKAKAEEIYDMWKDGEATEDSFAELAEEYSEDPGSASNGGLYEEVYPGQMVDAFNDWCFDASRQVGDSGIVETDYGYHIMYFSGTCDQAYWYVVAEQDYLTDRQQEIMQAILDDYPVEVDYDKVVLANSGMLG